MSGENIKNNIVTVAVSGVMRTLNLEQVIFATVGSTTSRVHVNEGASSPPTFFDIEGDFRNLVAGRAGIANIEPVFGEFTGTGGSPVPTVLNFNQITRFFIGGEVHFAQYGDITGFPAPLLESPADVLGNVGKSLADVGMFAVNETNLVLAAPAQLAAATAHSGGTVPDATYFIKLTATNANGETTGSNEVSIVVAGTIADESTLTVNWTADIGATTYTAYIGTSAGAENVKLAGLTGTTHTFTALPVTAGTVPSTNTATLPNIQEFANIKNVTVQVPSGGHWATTFIDSDAPVFLESLLDLAGIA